MACHFIREADLLKAPLKLIRANYLGETRRGKISPSTNVWSAIGSEAERWRESGFRHILSRAIARRERSILVRDGDNEHSHVEACADAVWRVRSVLSRLEEWLEGLDDGTVITPSQALSQVAEMQGVYDQVMVALRALESLGVLQPGKLRNRLCLNRSQLLATRQIRIGVWAGLKWAQDHIIDANAPARLVAALPLGLRNDVVTPIQRQADDLRAALTSLITGAREELLLASPFWDDETVGELEPLLMRRIEIGVRLVILGRQPIIGSGQEPHGFARLATSLARCPGFSAFVWDEPLALDKFGSQTFHFKCAVADHGNMAYLGSANLTSASLRSRMELGVVQRLRVRTLRALESGPSGARGLITHRPHSKAAAIWTRARAVRRVAASVAGHLFAHGSVSS